MEGDAAPVRNRAQLKLSLPQKLRELSWQEWAFALGLMLYLLTRLIHLDKFPIYFFTDEAIQTMSAVDLLARGLRDASGRLLPVYFENGGQYNLSLSVYLQLIPALLPRSVFLTRAVPAVISLVVPISMGLALRDFFKARLWWAAPAFMAAVPAWFLHSRTAFETSLGVSMFSLFLYFYLCYRLKNRRYLPWAFLFGALAFYAYSPMQLVVVLTGVVLLGVDWRYHWADRKGLLRGLAVLVLLAAPYVRFRLQYPEALGQHLTQLQSYWVSSQSLGAKIGEFFRRYLHGFDPTYWFLPNSSDLIRHQMKGMGHMRLISLPFVLLGLGAAVRRLKDPAWRVVLIALLTAPAGAALVDVAITRLLVMVVPLGYLALLGMEQVVAWLIQKHSQLVARWVGVGLALLWATLAGTMTVDALKNGPTWYEDYGLYGMQWGGETLFDEIKRFMQDHPEKEIPMIHVTGTNGKGSVSSMFAEVFRCYGLKVGFFSSPHLKDYPERINIQGNPVSWQLLSEGVLAVAGAADKWKSSGGGEPTEFDVLTASAFWIFAKEEVDIAIIEVGIGGTYDSTNVIQPILTVITNIAEDHLDKCGPELADGALAGLDDCPGLG